MTESGRPRVLLIALDAMEASFLDELFAKGRLPNLKRFADESPRLGVRSMGEHLHGSVWPTFASGVSPGHHGVYWWTQWLSEEMRHVRNSHEAFRYEPFWGGLARAGVRTCVVDVPYAPLVNVDEVRQFTGWGSHDEVEVASWPETFGYEIRRRFGRHPLSMDTVEPQSSRDKLQMVRGMRKGVAMRAKMSEELVRERRDDLLVLMFGETHKLGHYLAAAGVVGAGKTNIELIGEALEPLDDAWPGILAAAGPDCHVMLFALHGVQPQVDYANSLSTQVLAIANGKPPAAGAPRKDLMRRVRDLLPDSVHRAIWKRMPASFRAARQGTLIEAGADFSTDRLIKVGHDGHLAYRVNQRGRERDGIVGPEESEGEVERLWELARQFTADDGRPAFTGLWRSAEEAPGPRAHRLPDALLLSNVAVRKTDSLAGPGGMTLHSTMPEARNGIHTGVGFCYFRAARGSGATPARAEWDALDFAPTVYDLLGVPALASFQGRSGVR